MTVKAIHVSCVILTYTLFLVRGIWMITGSTHLQSKWARRVPPVIDTLLLASAITLSVTLRQYPFVHDWLTAKIIGLVFYIGLGMLALTYGRTKRMRIGSWIAAQLCFFYIAAVALTKQPFPLP